MEFYEFDHSRFAAWPEYQAVGAAIDAFAHRLTREGVCVTQGDFERVFQDVARHLPASDCCEMCMKAHLKHESSECLNECYRAHPPFANRRDDGKVDGVYSCSQGHAWTCSHAARDIVVLMP